MWRFLKNLKIELPYDLAISLLALLAKVVKSVSPRDVCTPMSIAALFAIAKTGRQPKCPMAHEERKHCVYTHYAYIRICSGILHSHKKGRKPSHWQKHG